MHEERLQEGRLKKEVQKGRAKGQDQKPEKQNLVCKNTGLQDGWR